ncbi:MAG: hypothetical protein ACKV19_06635 [Verrucomicrobiales bacterium]
MKRRFDDYQRLARGVFGVSSLWLGPTDMLYVRGVGVFLPFAEEYIRFELDRIGSLAVVKTRVGLALNIIYGLFFIAAGGIGGSAAWQAYQAAGPEPRVLWSILSIPFLILAGLAAVLLVTNLALGPTCRFQVQTATRIERLRPVRRLRVARRVLDALAPALAAAQNPPTPAAPNHLSSPEM